MPRLSSSFSSRWPCSSSPIAVEQARLRAERLDVPGDVGRAAEPLLLLARVDAHDRHRRLGRDALDGAEPVAVEHRVADDEDARGLAAARGWERQASQVLQSLRRISVPAEAARALPEVVLRLEAAGGAAVAMERARGAPDRVADGAGLAGAEAGPALPARSTRMRSVAAVGCRSRSTRRAAPARRRGSDARAGGREAARGASCRRAGASRSPASRSSVGALS